MGNLPGHSNNPRKDRDSKRTRLNLRAKKDTAISKLDHHIAHTTHTSTKLDELVIRPKRDDEVKEGEETIFSNTEMEEFSLPPFLDPDYRPNDLMARRVMPVGANVWDYYEDTGETIGSGLSGSVICVVNKLTKERYAYKQFKFRGHSQKALNLSYNEIDLYLSMSHPYVAGLLQIFSDSEGFGMVMELCIGGNLVNYRLKKREQWNEDITRHLFFQMVLVVRAQHENNIAIRDIKLDNFVVQLNTSPDENLSPEETIHRLRAKLIDFGISRKIRPGVPMATRQGTLEYMAPEVFNSIYDMKADMWSLGACLFALIFAKFPYERSRIQHGHTEPFQYGVDREFPGELDPDAYDLLAHLLAYDPDLRPTCDEVLRHPWLKKEMGHLESLHAGLYLGDGIPTENGKHILSIIRGFFNTHPIVRSACAYASRFLPSSFGCKYDMIFMALTKGVDQITVEDKSLIGEDQLRRTVTYTETPESGSAIEGVPVQWIGWYEFLSAMMLATVTEEVLLGYIMNMVAAFQKTKPDSTSITQEDCIGMFGEDIVGTDTAKEFKKLLQQGRFNDPNDPDKLDLWAFVQSEKRSVVRRVQRGMTENTEDEAQQME